MKKQIVRVSLRLPVETWQALKDEAKKEYRSLHAVILIKLRGKK
jgi:hypothetical protein